MKQQVENGTLYARAVRQKLLHCVESAIKSISVPTPSDEQIHSVRKQLKRARANLRLLRDVIGKATYRRENTALRDAARPLSGIRDVAVLRKTADTFINTARRGPRRRLLLHVRKALQQAQREARVELRVMNAIKTSVGSLNAAMGRMRKWSFTRVDAASISRGLQRTYRRGRKAFAGACAHPTAEHLHEWRKQVKYLGRSLELWKAQGADDVKRLVKRADKLAELLGKDHDLIVFEERLKKLDSPHPIRPAITDDIGERRNRLVEQAFKKGHRLFKAKPRRFVQKIAHAGTSKESR